MKPSLVFVYNADSGLFNTVTDIAHKILSPKTYSCNLCAITHSYFSVKQQWADFLEELDVNCEFLHRDEFVQQYDIKDVSLPAIFLKLQDNLSPWLTAQEINECKDLDELKQRISEKLA